MSNSNIVDIIRNKNVLEINKYLNNEMISRYLERDIYNSCIILSKKEHKKKLGQYYF